VEAKVTGASKYFWLPFPLFNAFCLIMCLAGMIMLDKSSGDIEFMVDPWINKFNEGLEYWEAELNERCLTDGGLNHINGGVSCCYMCPPDAPPYPEGETIKPRGCNGEYQSCRDRRKTAFNTYRDGVCSGAINSSSSLPY